MGHNLDTTIRQSQHEKYERSRKHQSLDYDDYAQNGYHLTGEDHAISQQIVDGNISICGHDCQHHSLQANAYVDSVHLYDANTKHSLPEIEPKMTISLAVGDGGCGQANVSAGQLGQEVKHGVGGGCVQYGSQIV